MLDAINAKLIDVCWEYLEWKNLWLDKYQLATICAQLTTLAMEQCETPFFIGVKSNKALVKEYLEKNKSKREALERIKKENEGLDKELTLREKEAKEKKAQIKKVNLSPESEMPSQNSETGRLGKQPPVSKPKPRAKWVDALAIDNFSLPKR